jgi:hypothetical protein
MDWAGKDIAAALLIYALSFLTNNLSIHQLKTIIYEK